MDLEKRRKFLEDTSKKIINSSPKELIAMYKDTMTKIEENPDNKEELEEIIELLKPKIVELRDTNSDEAMKLRRSLKIKIKQAVKILEDSGVKTKGLYLVREERLQGLTAEDREKYDVLKSDLTKIKKERNERMSINRAELEKLINPPKKDNLIPFPQVQLKKKNFFDKVHDAIKRI